MSDKGPEEFDCSDTQEQKYAALHLIAQQLKDALTDVMNMYACPECLKEVLAALEAAKKAGL